MMVLTCTETKSNKVTNIETKDKRDVIVLWLT